jgi:hypothetical protein
VNKTSNVTLNFDEKKSAALLPPKPTFRAKQVVESKQMKDYLIPSNGQILKFAI